MPWGLSALQRTPREPSYQRSINTLYPSMRELDMIESEKYNDGSRRAEGSRTTLWSSTGSKKSDSDCHSETFMAEFIDVFFNGQRRWGRNPKVIKRGKSSITYFRKPPQTGPCFNCSRDGCSLKTFDQPRNYNGIKQNRAQWRQRK